MKNKFLIPFFIVLVFSWVYNFIKIDSRMDLMKNENALHVMGIGAAIVGILFCVVIFRLNGIKRMVDKNQ